MNERIQERLADLKARQLAGEYMTCPRCGNKSMKESIHTNALSRHADIYICDQCGTDEAMKCAIRRGSSQRGGLLDAEPFFIYR